MRDYDHRQKRRRHSHRRRDQTTAYNGRGIGNALADAGDGARNVCAADIAEADSWRAGGASIHEEQATPQDEIFRTSAIGDQTTYQKGLEGVQGAAGTLGAFSAIRDGRDALTEGKYDQVVLNAISAGAGCAMAVHDFHATAGVNYLGGALEPISGAVGAFAELGLVMSEARYCYKRKKNAALNSTKLEKCIEYLGIAMNIAVKSGRGQVTGMDKLFCYNHDSSGKFTTYTPEMYSGPLKGLTLSEAAELNQLLHAALVVEDFFSQGTRSELLGFAGHGLAAFAKMGLNTSAIVLTAAGSTLSGGLFIAAGAVVGIAYAAGHTYMGYRRSRADKNRFADAVRDGDIPGFRAIEMDRKARALYTEELEQKRFRRFRTSPEKHRTSYSDYMRVKSLDLKQQIEMSSRYSDVPFFQNIISQWS